MGRTRRRFATVALAVAALTSLGLFVSTIAIWAQVIAVL